jgi:hypothetical protein
MLCQACQETHRQDPARREKVSPSLQYLASVQLKVIITHAPSMLGTYETHARPVEKFIASLAFWLYWQNGN